MIGRILIFISLIVFTVAHSPEREGSSTKTMDLYYTKGSAPCRAVMLTAKYLGITLNLKHIDLNKNEHKTSEFKKINHQHTIPVLVDDDLTIIESHAIIIYLVKAYAENDLLYPEDTRKQILVLQRLLFDVSVLYQRFSTAYYPLMKFRSPYTDEQISLIEEALWFLEMFLENSEYVAGNQLTVADFSLLASVTTIQAVEFDVDKYPNIIKWVEKTKSVFTPEAYEEVNGEGVKAFHKLYLERTKK